VHLATELPSASPSGPGAARPSGPSGHLPMNGEEFDQPPRQAGKGRIKKRVVIKTDGRYLIYYERVER